MTCLIAIWHFLYANKALIVSLGGLAITAGIRVLPPPGTKFDLYTFFYDWSHQFLNVNNNRVTTSESRDCANFALPVIKPPDTQDETNH